MAALCQTQSKDGEGVTWEENDTNDVSWKFWAFRRKTKQNLLGECCSRSFAGQSGLIASHAGAALEIRWILFTIQGLAECGSTPQHGLELLWLILCFLGRARVNTQCLLQGSPWALLSCCIWSVGQERFCDPWNAPVWDLQAKDHPQK